MNEENKMSIIDKRYYTDVEIAIILGISPSTLRTWRRRGAGPNYIKAEGKKGKVLYPIADFKQWEIVKMVTAETF